MKMKRKSISRARFQNLKGRSERCLSLLHVADPSPPHPWLTHLRQKSSAHPFATLNHPILLDFVFDKSLLDCPLCSLPLKPPVFLCQAKHAACGPCAANLASKCPACDGVYERDEGAYGYLLAVRVPCPNQAYGCGSSVVYCMVGDHRLVCPHAPCRCPEPGCGFLGPPPALRGHLFVASERGVKVVRVSATADEDGPSVSWYRCKVWVHAPVDTATGHMDVLLLDAKVESCAVPSEEAAMGAGGRYLPVPSDVQPPEGGGVVLRLRVDKEVRVKARRSPRSRA